MAKRNSVDWKAGLNLNLIPVLQGLIFTLLLLGLVSAVLALMVYFSSCQADPRLLNLLTHLSAIGGAIWAGRRCESKSWLHGILVGFFFFFILTWAGGNQALFITWLWLKRLLRMLAVAMLGGILGGLGR